MRRQSRKEALGNFGDGFIKIVGVIIIGMLVINFMGDDDSSSTSSNNANQTTVKNSENNNATDEKNSIVEVEAEVEPEPVIEVTATEVIDTYNANEIRGNETYSNKRARITGTIYSIDESFGSPYVIMSTDSDDWSFTDLQIFFEDPDSEPLSSLEKGQTITVEGIIDGMSINITVEDATILD